MNVEPANAPLNAPPGVPRLERRFGLLSATALNMTNMIGIGPFITIPLLMSALGGPQAMLGWFVAILITIPDGMVWSELAAKWPGSGGTYVYLREAFGREKLGRLMAFLFIWQLILSGPLEIASGYIGFSKYLGYVWPGLTDTQTAWIAAAVGALNIALLFRRIGSISKITVALWIGTLFTTGVVIVTGARHFNPALAFDLPENGLQFSLGFVMGLGAASRIGIYDYLGYYDVCYLGDEVREPQRVIPRSISLSIIGVALIYFAINLSIIGVVPWREFVPAENNANANYVVSLFMEKIYGHTVAAGFTALILWTAFGSVFALLLGYSRIPYAAALDGGFFKIFGRLHPKHHFPHVSLVALGLIAMVCCALPLITVIDALLTTRIVVQFIGQIVAVVLLRRSGGVSPYRMWLYPLPCLIALLGWVFVLITTGRVLLLQGAGFLAAGGAFFLVWSWWTRRWPFEKSASAAA